MRIRMNAAAYGPLGNFQPGSMVTIPDDLAAEWVSVGIAEAIESAPEPVEEAVISPPETAMQPRKRVRKA